MTSLQHFRLFDGMRSGTVSILCTTGSRMFCCPQKLDRIDIIDDHSSLYKMYRDPRYDVRICAEKMAEIYNAELYKW